MKTKTKMIFSAALAAALISLPRAQAATSGAPAPDAPAAATATATNNKPADVMTTLFGDPVIAKGKGFEIKQSQLDAEMLRIKSSLAAQGRTVSPQDVSTIEPRVLNDMITRQLLLSQATAADRAAGKAEFDKMLQQLKTSGKLTDDQFNQKLNQQLQLLNLTKEQWEKESTDQTTTLVVLKRDLNVSATDAEAKQFYSTNSAEFQMPEMVRAAHILISTHDPATGAELSDAQKAEKKKQIDDLLKRARAGEDFAKLAQQYSDDPGSKANGGEYTFPRGKMMPEFEAAAFSLQTNQVSDVITTTYGYHIIKLYEKIPAQKLALTDKVPSSNATVNDDIKNYLEQQKLAQLAPAYLKQLNKDMGVEILDPALKPLMTDDTNAPATLPAK